MQMELSKMQMRKMSCHTICVLKETFSAAESCLVIFRQYSNCLESFKVFLNSNLFKNKASWTLFSFNLYSFCFCLFESLCYNTPFIFSFMALFIQMCLISNFLHCQVLHKHLSWVAWSSILRYIEKPIYGKGKKNICIVFLTYFPVSNGILLILL